MNYEIRKVANGFMVTPANRDRPYAMELETFVFPTWGKAAHWLERQFNPEKRIMVSLDRKRAA